MGGSGIVDDIGWTIDHPASLYKFPNQTQGTICMMKIPGVGSAYGAIIGISRLTDHIFAGITLNNRMIMPSHFYDRASLFTESVWKTGSDNAKDYPNLPRLNLCIKFNESFKLGIGGYFEHTSNRLEETRRFFYTPQGDTAKVFGEYNYKQDLSVGNDGMFLEARISLGSWTLYPIVNAGRPRIGGTNKTDLLTAIKNNLPSQPASDSLELTDYEHSFGSAEGLYLKAGSHIWKSAWNTLFIGGAFYSEKKYQFNKVIDAVTEKIGPTGSDGTVIRQKEAVDSLTPLNDSKSIDVWLACLPTYADGLYFSPEYNGGLMLFNGNGPQTPPDSDTLFVKSYHNFRLGVEKAAKKIWIFDEVAFRFGIVAAWTSEYQHIKPKQGGNIPVSDEWLPWKSALWGSDYTEKQAKVTAGIGFHKGRGTVDISFNLKSWGDYSSFAGPPVALATLTVDLGKTK